MKQIVLLNIPVLPTSSASEKGRVSTDQQVKEKYLVPFRMVSLILACSLCEYSTSLLV